MKLFIDTANVQECYQHDVFSAEILVASIRYPRHLPDSALVGADIATVPYSVLKKAFNDF